MNTKQLRELAKEQHNDLEHIWLWEYPNRQFVWMDLEKSKQLDLQRKEISHANIGKS